MRTPEKRCIKPQEYIESKSRDPNEVVTPFAKMRKNIIIAQRVITQNIAFLAQLRARCKGGKSNKILDHQLKMATMVTHKKK